jgi:uncharacterized protein YdhG (YjbR/CyaY superfamily)
MAKKSATKKTTKSTKGFSDWEKAAMKERAAELKAEARAGKDREAGEKAVQAAIKVMKEPDRSMAKRIHEIVSSIAPNLMPKTWYGMPAYANKDGKVVCFFQAGQKYGTRYSTLGFQDAAKLDDSSMWPVSYALKEVTATEESKITSLVKKALG